LSGLVQALEDPEPEVRRRSVRALVQLGDDGAVAALTRVLNDADRDVRRWAARGLGMLGDASVLPALRETSNDNNPVVRDEVVEALRAIEDRQSLAVQRTRLEALRARLMATDHADGLTQVRLDGQIEAEQYRVNRLEARVAATHDVAPPPPEESGGQDRERRAQVFQLKRLIHEIEVLSTSVRAIRLREAWEPLLVDARGLLTEWSDLSQAPSVEDMRLELARRRQSVDARSEGQRHEILDLARHVQEGFKIQLLVDQLRDGLADPLNRRRAENWFREAGSEYRLLKVAQEEGESDAAAEHCAKLIELRERLEGVQSEEEHARRFTGLAVLGFLVVALASLFTLVTVLGRLPTGDKAAQMMPTLNLPYTVLAWSAIGAVSGMLYQFLHRPMSQLETFKWLIARPIQGIIMGSFLYLMVGAGLLVLVNPQAGAAPPPGSAGAAVVGSLSDLVRPELVAVIAFLGGFSDRFADEMVRRATSILARATAHGDDPPASVTESR
jgi:hypothetical protein